MVEQCLVWSARSPTSPPEPLKLAALSGKMRRGVAAGLVRDGATLLLTGRGTRGAELAIIDIASSAPRGPRGQRALQQPGSYSRRYARRLRGRRIERTSAAGRARWIRRRREDGRKSGVGSRRPRAGTGRWHGALRSLRRPVATRSETTTRTHRCGSRRHQLAPRRPCRSSRWARSELPRPPRSRSRSRPAHSLSPVAR